MKTVKMKKNNEEGIKKMEVLNDEQKTRKTLKVLKR